MHDLVMWAATPDGVAVTHSLAALLSAMAALLSAIAVRIAHGNRKLLDGHLMEHTFQAPHV